MKSVAMAAISGVALVAIMATPAGAQSQTEANAANTSHHAAASSWHPVTTRPGAHRTSTKAVASAKPVSTTRLIVRAIERSELLGAVRPAQITVSKVRVSKVDATWAAALVTPKDPNLADPADVVLHKTKGVWKAVDLGTAEVGCGLAPVKVIASLGLTCEA